jgi:hypothetical protein
MGKAGVRLFGKDLKVTWRTEWETISSRISGLERAANFYQGFMQQDNHSAGKTTLFPQSKDLYGLIESFLTHHKNALPEQAQHCLIRFVDESRTYINTDWKDPFRFIVLITKLLSFQAEFDYVISDTQQRVRSIVERAFTHLQRIIIADSHAKSIWNDTFIAGETECEKLGAAHLLLHGIWAFKTDAKGERTDLVLNEPLDIDQVERTSEGLVLTEWKVVRKASQAEKRMAEALRQARLYSQGIFGGIELSRIRYLVIVSEDRLDKMADIQKDEVIYRHINIAVDPKTPSQSKAKT